MPDTGKAVMQRTTQFLHLWLLLMLLLLLGQPGDYMLAHPPQPPTCCWDACDGEQAQNRRPQRAVWLHHSKDRVLVDVFKHRSHLRCSTAATTMGLTITQQGRSELQGCVCDEEGEGCISAGCCCYCCFHRCHHCSSQALAGCRCWVASVLQPGIRQARLPLLLAACVLPGTIADGVHVM